MIYGNTFQPDERFNGDNIVSLKEDPCLR